MLVWSRSAGAEQGDLRDSSLRAISSLLWECNGVDMRFGAETSQGRPGGLERLMTNVMLGITPYSSDRYKWATAPSTKHTVF